MATTATFAPRRKAGVLNAEEYLVLACCFCIFLNAAFVFSESVNQALLLVLAGTALGCALFRIFWAAEIGGAILAASGVQLFMHVPAQSQVAALDCLVLLGFALLVARQAARRPVALYAVAILGSGILSAGLVALWGNVVGTDSNPAWNGFWLNAPLPVAALFLAVGFSLYLLALRGAKSGARPRWVTPVALSVIVAVILFSGGNAMAFLSTHSLVQESAAIQKLVETHRVAKELQVNRDNTEKAIAAVNRSLLPSYLLALGLLGVALRITASEIKQESKGNILGDAEQSLEVRVQQRREELTAAMMRKTVAEKSVCDARQRLSSALAFSKTIAWTWEIAQDELTLLGPVEEVFGRSASGIANYDPHFKELIHPEDRGLVDETLKEWMTADVIRPVQFRIVRPNEEVRWIKARAYIVRDDQGKAKTMMGVSYDFTALKSFEDKLRESEARFRELADAMPQMVWTATDSGEFDYYNKRWSMVIGSVGDAVQTRLQDWSDVLHPDDYRHWRATWLAAVASGNPYEIEFRLRDVETNTYRWYLGRALPAKGAAGSVVRWFGTCTDIQDRKMAEEQFRTVVETAPSAFIVVQPDGIITLVNSRTETLFGYSRQELLGQAVEALIQSVDGSDWRGGNDLRGIRKDGSEIAVEVAFEPIATPQGDLILTSITDVTERRLNELKLKQSEEQFRSLANTMPELAWTAGPDGRQDYYNDRWYEVTGLKPTERAEEDWKAILHPEDWERQGTVWARSVRTGAQYEIEHRLWDQRCREFRWHLSRATPVFDANGAVARWFGVCTDIHEQKLVKELLEEQVNSRTRELRRALGEKETLLKEIHHRVKNNLQVVSSLLRMQGQHLSDPVAVEALKDSQSRVLSMALIHERLYGSQHMDEIDFGEYTHKLVAELFRSYAHSLKITSCVNADSVILNIDQAIPCGLILNELVTNGLKYAYPHGTVGELHVNLFETAAGQVVFSVSDAGAGLPPDFDWRQSKSLGLPIVNLLAKQIGGTFAVKGPPGATFLVEFRKQVKEDRSAA